MAHAPHYPEAAPYAPPIVSSLVRTPRKTTRARIFHGASAGPQTAARKPLVTPGSLLLLALMLGFGMYATGYLPQLDAFFTAVQVTSRAHNADVVGAVLAWFPALLLGFAILALGLFFFVTVQKRRAEHSRKPLAGPRRTDTLASPDIAAANHTLDSASGLDAQVDGNEAALPHLSRSLADTAEATRRALLEAHREATARALALARAEAEARAEALVRAAAADRAATSILLRHPPQGISTDHALGGKRASGRTKRPFAQTPNNPPVLSEAGINVLRSLSER